MVEFRNKRFVQNDQKLSDSCIRKYFHLKFLWRSFWEFGLKILSKYGFGYRDIFDGKTVANFFYQPRLLLIDFIK